jgi:hypothetical protein
MENLGRKPGLVNRKAEQQLHREVGDVLRRPGAGLLSRYVERALRTGEVPQLMRYSRPWSGAYLHLASDGRPDEEGTLRDGRFFGEGRVCDLSFAFDHEGFPFQE